MSYRSSWELNFAKLLDDDANVVSYSYEAIIIPYLSNRSTGKMRRYFPDFCVTYSDGSRVIVEIKPKRKLVQRVVLKKIASALKWCECNDVTFKVITEVELKEYTLSQQALRELNSAQK